MTFVRTGWPVACAVAPRMTRISFFTTLTLAATLGFGCGGAEFDTTSAALEEDEPAPTVRDPYTAFNIKFIILVDNAPLAACRRIVPSTIEGYTSSSLRVEEVQDLGGLEAWLEQGTSKTVTIELLDESRNEVMSWNFDRMRPTKWTGPTLNARNSEVAFETIELASADG